ncbi:amidohydrolase family protein [Terriglobus sp. RCC_193]|uniref:amidohydrolase family protein n=1 Tax=Terriglobus sp. RCC_193 TaxID=3239218 RepID=UPI0035262501
MKIIAIEEHFLTAEIRAAWAASAIGTEGTSAFDRGEVEARLDDLGEGRIVLMDESGVDVQVLSVTTPALHNLDVEVSVPLARHTNDLLAAAIAKYPDRFQGFATLPTAAPDEAALELERAVQELGFHGAMLCGRTRDRNLDHPDFLPMFGMAEKLGVPMYIHPQIPQQTVRNTLYGGFNDMTDIAFATFGLGWHYEAGIQFVRMILAGIFDKHPQLQMILGHWGEVVLFYTERLKNLSRVQTLQRPVLDVMRENLYVTPSGMWNELYFRHAVDVVGIDRVLFSADYPYQYRPGGAPRQFLEQLSISTEDKAKIAYGNWERLTSSHARAR